MGYDSSSLRSPKKEEEEHVPDTNFTEFYNFNEAFANEEIDVLDELEGIWGVKDEEKLLRNNQYGHLNRDFMEWEKFAAREEEDEEREKSIMHFTECFEDYCKSVKRENIGFWNEDDKRVSLNLNLNYQEVLDAWSDRGSLWANDCYVSMVNDNYMGEVPMMEEEKSGREARVLRYKEKRQTRLFSKKIRYQVRKLNADKRPRLKGRFVKRVPEN